MVPRGFPTSSTTAGTSSKAGHMEVWSRCLGEPDAARAAPSWRSKVPRVAPAPEVSAPVAKLAHPPQERVDGGPEGGPTGMDAVATK